MSAHDLRGTAVVDLEVRLEGRDVRLRVDHDFLQLSNSRRENLLFVDVLDVVDVASLRRLSNAAAIDKSFSCIEVEGYVGLRKISAIKQDRGNDRTSATLACIAMHNDHVFRIGYKLR